MTSQTGIDPQAEIAAIVATHPDEYACKVDTPIVTDDEAAWCIRRLGETTAAALLRSFEWLVTRHPGLTAYEGVTGRPYTTDEQNALQPEVVTAAFIRCPFLTEVGCSIKEARPLACRDLAWKGGRLLDKGFLPTLIVKALDRPQLVALVQAHQVADVKMARGLLDRARFGGDIISGKDLRPPRFRLVVPDLGRLWRRPKEEPAEHLADLLKGNMHF